MKANNPFDRALEAHKTNDPWHGAAIDVTDTLDLAWIAAQAVFEQDARPEHALAICDMILRRVPPATP